MSSWFRRGKPWFRSSGSAYRAWGSKWTSSMSARTSARLIMMSAFVDTPLSTRRAFWSNSDQATRVSWLGGQRRLAHHAKFSRWILATGLTQRLVGDEHSSGPGKLPGALIPISTKRRLRRLIAIPDFSTPDRVIGRLPSPLDLSLLRTLPRSFSALRRPASPDPFPSPGSPALPEFRSRSGLSERRSRPGAVATSG
jgi:hypothetical protein